MKRVVLQWVLPLAVTIGLLALAFTLIDHPERIPGYIASVPLHVHVLFIAVSLVSFYCRAFRWRALLPDYPLTANQCFGPLMIGFMMNALLPARAGEFARCVALGQRRNLPFSAALGSVVLERIFDGVILLASFAVVLGMLGATLPDEVGLVGERTVTGEQLQLAIRGAAITVVGILVVVVSLLMPGVRRLVARIAGAILPAKLSHFIVDQLEKLVRGFRSLHSPVTIAVIIAWTLVVWATVAFSCQVGAWGFPEIADMTFLQAWAVTVFVCIFILLPASPGYWGLYEIGVIAACATLGLTTEAAVALAYSVVIHFWQIATTVLMGLFFLWREGFNLRQLMAQRQKGEAPAAPAPGS